MNIVMLSTMDCANSGNEIAKAVNKFTNHNVRVITCVPHPFKYNRDIEIFKTSSSVDKLTVRNLINKADLIHMKGDQTPGVIWRRFSATIGGGIGPLPVGKKPIISSPAGNSFRRPIQCEDPLCRAHHPSYSYGSEPISKFLEESCLRTTLTPDLNYPEFKGFYSQQTIDSKSAPYLWKPNPVPIIAHSPSIRGIKGTDDLFLPAMKILKARGHNFELDMIENCSSKESAERKKRATIFFDQCSVGAYGMSLLEAVQYGIPSAAWISDHSMRQSDGKLVGCPVINFKTTVEDIVRVFDEFLRSDMNQLSIRTKRWADAFHGYHTVAKMWDEFYREAARHISPTKNHSIKEAKIIETKPIEKSQHSGLQVAVLSLKDYANAAWHIGQAVNRVGDHHARVIIGADTCASTFGYPRDIVLRGSPKNVEFAINYIKNSDIIHLKGDEPLHVFDTLMANTLGVKSLKDFKKPIVLSVEGSNFRRSPDGKKYPHALAEWSIEDYVNDQIYRTTLTPDLNYPEYKGVFVPQAIDSRACKNIWKPRSTFVISHSPSNRKKKGTDTLFLPAMRILQRKYKLKIDLITKVSHSECNRRKKNSTIFFDQVLAGYYGYAAMECAQYGIPIAAWVSKQAMAQGKIRHIPVIICEPTIEGIVKTFNKVLRGDLAHLSRTTKEWIDNFHSYETVGKIWGNIYEDLV